MVSTRRCRQQSSGRRGPAGGAQPFPACHTTAEPEQHRLGQQQEHDEVQRQARPRVQAHDGLGHNTLDFGRHLGCCCCGEGAGLASCRLRTTIGLFAGVGGGQRVRNEQPYADDEAGRPPSTGQGGAATEAVEQAFCYWGCITEVWRSRSLHQAAKDRCRCSLSINALFTGLGACCPSLFSPW